ncbi:flagellar export protein FliJ [Conexibacter sp. SYSU D00693]|uniref:flagellar export protein FliJ n=1 Tax=Conexibacter sp. SYSU D00693 TaxID=2812560 RepID=UPI00196B9CCB|nr:flagellar export protein FliJ [Conexibacter sp. SYSU D00693]
MKDKPFKFGLERVRELRAHDEDRAKEAFAASLNERVRGAAHLADAEGRLRAAVDGARPATDPGAPSLSGSDLLARQTWVERLERHRADAAHLLADLDQRLADSRASLAHASRNREVLERLKARRGEEHRLEALRAEAVELDEMATRMHGRAA